MRSLVLRLVVFALTAATASPAQQDPTSADWFERRIRPLLANRCFECHGPSRQKSGLRLDHGELQRRGGERGPAIVPGDPDASLMMRAVGYHDVDLQMPPRGRLDDVAIDDLRHWIAAGAPWPDEPVPSARVAGAEAAFDLDARRAAHWCWQAPVQHPVPTVTDPAWAADPVDRFVRARLDAAGLEPAAAADRRTWLRRVTFALTGLPPSLDDLDAFVSDAHPDARKRVVDRLLASPAYGERMARHWMDLTRYAETLGHEFDFELQGMWRYRDYLIRAFRDDVPYDRIAREHLAGDLLPPRISADTGENEAPIATATLWLNDRAHSPVDTVRARADRIDNAIDVISKSFLGLTVACARCHDHKFDAIGAADYYALAGVLRGARYTQHGVAPQQALRSAIADLSAARVARLRSLTDEPEATARRIAARLRAVGRVPVPPAPAADDDARSRQVSEHRAAVEAVATAEQLDADRLEQLAAVLRSAADRPDDPLHAIGRLAADGADRGAIAAIWPRGPAATDPGRADDADLVLLDARQNRAPGWFERGPAFPRSHDDGASPLAARSPLTIAAAPGVEPALRLADGAWFDTASLSTRLWGTLESPRFRIDRRFLHLRVAGSESRVNVVLDDFHLIRAPIYGQLKPFIDGGEPRWLRIDLDMWRGHEAYLQLVDATAPDPADPHRRDGYGDDGWIAIQYASLSDDPEPPFRPDADAARALGSTPPKDLADLAARYGRAGARAIRAVAGDALAAVPGDLAILDALIAAGAVDAHAPDTPATIAWQEAHVRLPTPLFVAGCAEGDAIDQPIHVRGSHRDLGRVVPRRFLAALGGAPTGGSGSGRLAWARELTAVDNPLFARVAVNRVWHHVFGSGLVRTVDNFGRLGEPPTHPELLDRLALDFVADGHSLKRLIRRLVLTRTFASSSVADPRAARVDPRNALWHHIPVRRLDGEALRDAMLAVSGRLDPQQFGPSVPIHLTDFMNGRGRPGRKGPLDGDGRRSVYIEVRRNFLSPIMLAFDTPIPFTTVGRRAVSNVPAQALTLMNDPFVHQQARRWAEREAAAEPDAELRIERMYRRAFARPPSSTEREAARRFVTAQAADRGVDDDHPDVWTDLAHVLFNVKEFAFVR